ncbi:hypothetical protein BDD12DRAFT_912511 [Trichophaea hybrida]|nr:hypothetical protein BDD12DRAFT_912511 [Trichophaea hybrida]
MYVIGAATYISEIAPLEIRGVMLTLVNLSLFSGRLTASVSYKERNLFRATVPGSSRKLHIGFWGRVRPKPLRSPKQLIGGNDNSQRLKEIENTVNNRTKPTATYFNCLKGSNLRLGQRWAIIAAGILVGQ